MLMLQPTDLAQRRQHPVGIGIQLVQAAVAERIVDEAAHARRVAGQRRLALERTQQRPVGQRGGAGRDGAEGEVGALDELPDVGDSGGDVVDLALAGGGERTVRGETGSGWALTAHYWVETRTLCLDSRVREAAGLYAHAILAVTQLEQGDVRSQPIYMLSAAYKGKRLADGGL